MSGLLLLSGMKLIGIGMTVMHRMNIVMQKAEEEDDHEERREQMEPWGWLLYDIAWIKVGLVQPLSFLVVAHAIGALLLLVGCVFVKKLQVCTLHVVSMLSLVLLMSALRMNLIGAEGYETTVSALSMVFLLYPVLLYVRHAKRMVKETGSKWAWQLVAYASFLAAGVKDPDCPVELCVALAAGVLSAAIPLVMHSIMRPRWILVGGKLKEKSSFTLTTP